MQPSVKNETLKRQSKAVLIRHYKESFNFFSFPLFTAIQAVLLRKSLTGFTAALTQTNAYTPVHVNTHNTPFKHLESLVILIFITSCTIVKLTLYFAVFLMLLMVNCKLDIDLNLFVLLCAAALSAFLELDLFYTVI